jgi:hypothetical protein
MGFGKASCHGAEAEARSKSWMRPRLESHESAVPAMTWRTLGGSPVTGGAAVAGEMSAAAETERNARRLKVLAFMVF